MADKHLNLLLSLLFALLQGTLYARQQDPQELYPSAANRKISPGETSYFIDPENGNDKNPGTSPGKSWRTFSRLNQMILSPGDKVTIRPGGFHQSLILIARGSAKAPVSINFVKGRFDIFPDSLYLEPLHISNTNDVPYEPKAIALHIRNSHHVQVTGREARLIMRGKIIETFVNRSENIHIEGLSYDYHRPTVSELKVTAVTTLYADLEIHPQSTYSIKDSVLTWEGEGWRYQPRDYWQVFEPASGYIYRQGIQFSTLKITGTGTNKIRAYFSKNPGFTAGFIYQNRDVTRDCAGIVLMQSKNISLNKIRIYFMHGMGIVSQFCHNILIDGITVKPQENSDRTCAAWADILHFSGCSGEVTVANSYLSAANDDAINVHGTHIRITEKLSENKLKVRFMHGQTYGFNPFISGDTADFIRAKSLRPFSTNVVSGVQQLNDREFILTFENVVPYNLKEDDVLENVTQTPSVWVHHTTLTRVPTRGILVTSRRKVVIENNHFSHTHHSAILIEDDAQSWYESGMVRDVSIRENIFTDCGEPVIGIHPENHLYDGPVHQNITISHNTFQLKNTKILTARSTRNIIVSHNKIKSLLPVTIESLIGFEDCTDVKIRRNTVK